MHSPLFFLGIGVKPLPPLPGAALKRGRGEVTFSAELAQESQHKPGFQVRRRAFSMGDWGVDQAQVTLGGDLFLLSAQSSEVGRPGR